MARIRNRAQEEARRNARARELGFPNRSAMRRAMQKGTVSPERDSRGKIVGARPTGKVSDKPIGPRQPAFNKAGFASEYQYRKARKASKEWSRKHSHKPVSSYRSDMTPGEFRKYYDAFVNPDTARDAATKRDYLRRWLVDEQQYVDAEEFDLGY